MKKADFQEYRALRLEVQQLKDQLVELESSLYSPRGQRISSTPRAPSGGGSALEGAMDRHAKLEARYREELAEKEARLLALENAITSLKDAGQRVVMRERYLRGQRWPAVVAKLQKSGYSERQVYRLHGFALSNLEGFENA